MRRGRKPVEMILSPYRLHGLEDAGDLLYLNGEWWQFVEKPFLTLHGELHGWTVKVMKVTGREVEAHANSKPKEHLRAMVEGMQSEP